MSISRLLKIYNMILLPLVVLFFALLYISIRINSYILLYTSIALVILAPFISYFLAKKVLGI